MRMVACAEPAAAVCGQLRESKIANVERRVLFLLSVGLGLCL